MKQHSYPHMCKMDHVEIGHADSGDDERCPVCKALDHIYWLTAAIKGLPNELHFAASFIRTVGKNDAMAMRLLKYAAHLEEAVKYE